MLTLEAPFASPVSTVSLPSAELSNTIASDDTLNVQQAMSGIIYSYARTNTNEIISISLRNVAVDVQEALRVFIGTYGSVDIKITDHASRVWKAMFSISPITFSTTGRALDTCEEVGTITLQFIGARQ